MHSAQKSAIKNWTRIHNSKTNSIMIASYKGAVTDGLDWFCKTTSSIEEIGLGNVLNLATPLKDNFHSVYFRRCKDIFYQNAYATIANPDSKLRTYNLIKESGETETYLKVIKNVKDRISLSRFRLSNHKLLIETGRHENLNREDRICPFCCTQSLVEDEIHFLTRCILYNKIRKPLYEMCTELKPNFTFYSDVEQFKFLMTCEFLQPAVAKFVSMGMWMRNERNRSGE